MTISKLTNNIQPLDEVDKINEIIDEAVVSDTVNTVWTGTRQQYDAITTKDANTLYNITDDTDVTLTLLNTLYPIGAIYIGTMGTCPLQALGVGTWSLIAANRVLQGSGTNTAGSTVEAGLPNITGQLNNVMWCGDHNLHGVFSQSGIAYNAAGTNSGAGAWDVQFSASNSNSIYGNSSTVQPPAYIVNIWERTA